MISDWLKHAFALGPRGPFEPTEAQRDVVDKVCKEVVRRHLTVPAVMFMEMFRPLNYLGAQAMYFFQPIVSAILRGDGYRTFTEFLEQRGSVDYMCERVQALDALALQGKAKKSGTGVQE